MTHRTPDQESCRAHIFLAFHQDPVAVKSRLQIAWCSITAQNFPLLVATLSDLHHVRFATQTK
ncbi:hypothetical protein M758_1G287500 [Ceratodon purpureus]|nr:hypothetical protein M758_1G287500 [Ceratodon purpureus]